MRDRKQYVISAAHQLFINKGYQATSIQDIIDNSGISKGTFYNYFSSKNELLIEIFQSISETLEREQKKLLIGHDPKDLNIFTDQIVLHMEMNRANKLITLYEEAINSNDPELKDYLQNRQLKILYWIYLRFIDLFDHDKKPFLLDCAIMFLGILTQNIKYFAKFEKNGTIRPVVQYCVNRIARLVDEVSIANEQIFPPQSILEWLPDSLQNTADDKLLQSISNLQKQLNLKTGDNQYVQLLDFLADEMIHLNPRFYIIESVLNSLKSLPPISNDWHQELSNLEQFIKNKIHHQ